VRHDVSYLICHILLLSILYNLYPQTYMEPEIKPIHHIKVLSYNTLVQKYPFTQSVKNDSGWRSYSWASRREQLILKIVS
jgi:mRNA deadenylase 3'-5' endonuclease subunit Ccr4